MTEPQAYEQPTELDPRPANEIEEDGAEQDAFMHDTDGGCPVCGSDQTEGDAFDTDRNEVSQEQSCLRCNSRWTAIFQCTGFRSLTKGTPT